MMMNCPRATAMPPSSAAPYPLAGTSTRRAPSATAISWEPSTLPLSAINTSPLIFDAVRKERALRMHVASVSRSLRQGMRIVSSISPGSTLHAGADVACSFIRGHRLRGYDTISIGLRGSSRRTSCPKLRSSHD